jgi:hypothetical protein
MVNDFDVDEDINQFVTDEENSPVQEEMKVINRSQGHGDDWSVQMRYDRVNRCDMAHRHSLLDDIELSDRRNFCHRCGFSDQCDLSDHCDVLDHSHFADHQQAFDGFHGSNHCCLHDSCVCSHHYDI